VHQELNNGTETKADVATDRIRVAMQSESSPDILAVTDEVVDAEGLSPFGCAVLGGQPADGTDPVGTMR
jgi:hypothetical protein